MVGSGVVVFLIGFEGCLLELRRWGRLLVGVGVGGFWNCYFFVFEGGGGFEFFLVFFFGCWFYVCVIGFRGRV